MQSLRAVRAALAGVALLAIGASNASAQVDIAVTGGVDLTNQYNFRGIRQNFSEVSIWPYIDLGIPAWSGDGALKAVTINLGTWNAFNTELPDNKWYESDLYATLGLGFGSTVLSFNYTSYTSPADIFPHVKEFGIKLAYDDSGALGGAALKPYVLVAFELDDAAQADAGAAKGTYVELGVAPGYTGSRASIAFPIKVGLSASDYYEFGGLPPFTGDDSKFGYFSIAGIVTVPLGSHFNIHGGGELQVFGENVKIYNGFGDAGDSSTAGIASIGLGFSF
jgi:hypothetical protein